MKKIAVRAPQWLGDAVVSTVFLDRLRRKNEGAHITVITYPFLTPVFDGCPSIDAVAALPPKNQKSLRAASALIRQGHFDEIYVLPRSLRTALEAWSGGVPKRVGFAADFRSFFLTDRFPYSHDISLAHRYLRLIGEDTLPDEKMKAYYPKAVAMPEPALKGPVLGVAPWSIAPARSWLPGRFVDVANRFLAETHGTVVLFGSTEERAASAQLQTQIKGNVVDTTGGLDLYQLGTMIRRCDAMVVNDSGLMHIAAACNVPLVAIFGAGDMKQALPRFGRCVGRQHPEIPCVPCLRNRCVRFGPYYNECQKKVTADEVFDALRTLLPAV
jgi:heptosyltransferase-2